MILIRKQILPSGRRKYYFLGIRFWTSRPQPRISALDVTYEAALMKYHALARMGAVIETLVIGSSHGFFGFMAADHEFNAAEPSCDAYYMEWILRRLLERGMPALRHLIIFYDIFLPGSQTDLSSESYRTIPWKILYKIDSPCQCVRQDTRIGCTYIECDRYFKTHLAKEDVKVPDDYRGNPAGFCPIRRIDPEWRASVHEKLRFGAGLDNLSRMFELARANGAHVTVVMPPMRSDFRRCVQTSETELFREVRNLCKGNANWLNYYSDERFSDADFMDTDHLNEIGARKLTLFIRAEEK